MYSNGKTVPGEYPVSYCMNRSEGYGTVRKANKDELGPWNSEPGPCKN